jgi:hypothetical protein
MRTEQRTSDACGVGTKTVCKVKQCDFKEWEVDEDHVETGSVPTTSLQDLCR